MDLPIPSNSLDFLLEDGSSEVLSSVLRHSPDWHEQMHKWMQDWGFNEAISESLETGKQALILEWTYQNSECSEHSWTLKSLRARTWNHSMSLLLWGDSAFFGFFFGKGIHWREELEAIVQCWLFAAVIFLWVSKVLWSHFYHFQCLGNMSLLEVRLHQIQLFTKQREKDISCPCLFNAVCQAAVQDFESYKLQNTPFK